MEQFLNDEQFARQDESDDAIFYETPRLVTHLDAVAIFAYTNYLATMLKPGDRVLDLMSSCVSHLPEDMAFVSVIGLGMNGVELDENSQLTEFKIQDINKEPVLPFENQSFDACIISLSVQYMTRPVEVFRDINRVLSQRAPCIVSYSNRMFPTKAVAIWMALGDVDRARLIAMYLNLAGGYDEPDFEDLSPAPNQSDPLYVVSARRAKP